MFDLHSHHPRPDTAEQRSLYNLDLAGDSCAMPPQQRCSIGWHPWHLERCPALEELRARLLHLGESPQVAAIGETGLDALIATPLEQQLAVFQVHLEVAAALHKPVIIHCVQAHQPLLTHWKRNAPRGLVGILHGFHKKFETTALLVNAGFFVSFGVGLLKNPAARGAFAQIPAERCFLETDELPAEQLAAIYAEAAALRGWTLETCRAQIEQNARAVFGEAILYTPPNLS